MSNLAIKAPPRGMDTTYLEDHLHRLGYVAGEMRNQETGEAVDNLLYSASLRYFDIVLEQCGKLLRKRMRGYFSTSRQADELTFKGVFRYAGKHGLLDLAAVERWFQYREMRDQDTEHDYDRGFAERLVGLLPGFVKDAEMLVKALKEAKDG